MADIDFQAMIASARERIEMSKEELDNACKQVNLSLDDVESAREDVDRLKGQIAKVEGLASNDRLDLCVHPGVMAVARKAVVKSEKCLQSEVASLNRAQDRIHRAEAEVKLRQAELDLLLLAQAELDS